jgi:hypothetical protein
VNPNSADRPLFRDERPGDSAESIVRLEAERDRAVFNLQLEREKFKRLQAEFDRRETDLLQVELDRKVLLSRLEQAEEFVSNMRASRGWRLLERIRALVGRRWD